jgi:hypothetical protein
MPFIVNKRLMGKEDIQFDLAGDGSTFSVTDSEGNVLVTTKLAANHLPILAALRTKFAAATDVNTALDELIDGLDAIGSASLTEAGLIEIADASEVATGTDATRAITPAGLFSATPSTTQRAIVRAATQAEVEAGASGTTMLTPLNSQYLPAPPTTGRLVKFLTTSGSLTINDDADDSVAAYLTSNEIKSGTYLVTAYGAGGGGCGGSASNAGGGGGGGGVSRSILIISSSTAYTIGAGGTGGAASGSSGTTGGDTIISSITATGGSGGGIGTSYLGGVGGSGTLGNGADGSNAESVTGNESGGSGGGLYSGRGGLNSPGLDGDKSSGGGGGSNSNIGGDGGDGYIEIYEWEA